MIQGTLQEWETLCAQHPCLAAGFAFIQEHAEGDLSSGRHIIDGDNLFVDVHRYETQPVEAGMFENHEKYIDIQYVIDGCERMSVCPAEGMQEKTPYDPQKDAGFFFQPGDNRLTTFEVGAKSFAVFFPGEAHMPGRTPESGTSNVTKYVVKVLVAGRHGQ